MKLLKRIAPLLLCCCLLVGCSWMNGSYSSVTPYTGDSYRAPADSITVSNYKELEQALRSVIDNVGTRCTLHHTWFMQDTDEMMRGAISSVMSGSAMGAYAVEKISYDIGTGNGQPAISVEISYRYSRSELLRIKNVVGMESALNLIAASLENYSPNMILKVTDYEETDLSQLVLDYALEHPNICMEIPQVSVSTYPEKGTERIIVLNYTYQTSRDSLRDMQEAVSQVFSSAELYVNAETEDWQKYYQLYGFLMERYDYKIETSITPSYSLLLHGVGDSKAFAGVYAAMCNQAGLNCSVVSGTRNGEAYFWNIILDEGTYYHVDLLRCNENDKFMPKTHEQMSGYVWDYSAYEVAVEDTTQ